MSTLLLVGVVLICVVAIVMGFINRKSLLEFPFLVTVSFVAYLLPQYIALFAVQQLPSGALEKMLFMTIACFLACMYGYWSNRGSVGTPMFGAMDYLRLRRGAIVLMVLGAYFFYQAGRISATEDLGQQWSGPITIYVFLGQFFTVGTVLAFLLHAHRPSRTTLVMTIVGLLFFLHRGLVVGRRTALVEFFLFSCMVLYYRYRFTPSRVLTGVSLVLLAFFVNSTVEYRSTLREKQGAPTTFSALMDINYIENFLLSFTRAPDATNAVYLIDTTDRDLNLDYGSNLYNALVNRFIPGQIVGEGAKKSLYIGEYGYDFGDHVPRTGTTITGVGFAFASFWYLGFFWFYLIGALFGRWFTAAEAGSFVSQAVLALTLYQGMICFIFSPADLFLRIVFLGFVLVPLFVFASRGREQGGQHFSPAARA